MSISGALNSAVTGLRAAGLASEVVANNIANALNPDYGTRGLELSAAATTRGVNIVGVTRNVDAFLLSDTRLASAERGLNTETAEFLSRIESLLGTPDQSGSLTARLADFENALITATSRPDATERLHASVNAARDLATSLNQASDGIQNARRDAEYSIDEQVNRLNQALENIETLNGQIVASQTVGNSTAAMLDHRQAIIDEISEMVPVRVDARPNGAVALYTTGGAIILDGNAAHIEFDRNNGITPYASIASGTLSGLAINGTPIETTSDRSVLRGGTLIAQFEVRDELAVEAQSQLDAISRDLIDRFADPAVDPTLGAGDAGLFTDAGAAFDPLDELGLSARLSINAAVDPDLGGEAWRIRDGIGAATPGSVGDSTLLQNLTDTLSNLRTPSSGDFGTGAFGATELMSSFLSQIASDRLQADQRMAFSVTQHDELVQLELANGVDSDAELQRLILIEQVYAANARIIQTADEMMQSLLRI